MAADHEHGAGWRRRLDGLDDGLVVVLAGLDDERPADDARVLAKGLNPTGKDVAAFGSVRGEG